MDIKQLSEKTVEIRSLKSGRFTTQRLESSYGRCVTFDTVQEQKMKSEFDGRSIWANHRNEICLQRPAHMSSLKHLLLAIDTTGSPPTLCRVSNYFQG